MIRDGGHSRKRVTVLHRCKGTTALGVVILTVERCKRRRAVCETTLGVFAVVLVGVTFSCRSPFIATADIVVGVAPLSDTYHELAVGWEVRWWDGNSVRSRTLHPEAARLPRELTIETTAAGAEVVVVAAHAVPYLDGANEDGIVRMKSAGAWTAHPRRGLDLSFAMGPLAETLLDAAERGLDPALVNIERLEGEVRRVSGGDPSSLDRDRLFTALLAGEITRYDVSRIERPEVVIRLGSDRAGAWHSDDIHDAAAEGVVAEGSVYWTIAVGVGEVRRYWRSIGATPELAAAASSDRYWEIITVRRASDGHAYWYMMRRPAISPPH